MDLSPSRGFAPAGPAAKAPTRLHELFSRQAARRPGATALIAGAERISYSRLERWSDRLAARLTAARLEPEELVGIIAERSAGMVAALIGVLKAGGAYLPIDPHYPAERVAFLLRDGRCRAVMADALGAGRLGGFGGLRLGVADPGGRLRRPAAPSAGRLAYALYTSGSTGAPKGTLIEHGGVIALVTRPDFFDLGPEEVFLQLAPLTFDATILEIWAPLLAGGTVALAGPGIPSIDEIGAAIHRHGVTSLSITPGLLRMLVDLRPQDLGSVRQILCGGDVLPPAQADRILSRLPGCRLVNGYGPTEGTGLACCHVVTRADFGRSSVPIGRPVGGREVTIRDRALRPLPAGAPGELCIGGEGLARGYLNRPDLTAERFVADPARPGCRLYRTGDLARRLPDGAIEFIGRADGQVKIHGQRIELGEIEAALRRHSGVAEAAVLARAGADPLDKALWAYWAGTAEAAELREHLRRELPRHMVPACYRKLPSLPLLPNGKTDRQRLLEMRGSPP